MSINWVKKHIGLLSRKNFHRSQNVAAKQNITESHISTNTITERSHKRRLRSFFKSNPDLPPFSSLPEELTTLKRNSAIDNLYLLDSNIAKSVVSQVLPFITDDTNQIICETNAGLGLISKELLENGIKQVRLYETSYEFRENLKGFDLLFPGRVELFTKDIFTLYRYAYMDKTDNGNRVEQMLKKVPKKSWSNGPVMTILGTMPKMDFIKYLIYTLVLQCDIFSLGRIQMFAMMSPRDYTILTATPEDNLHTYQFWSVLSSLLLDIKLLEKYPRNMFLPWTTQKLNSWTRFPDKVEPDKMYLVHIDVKKELPVSSEHLVPLYYFMKTLFKRGKEKIIPSVEKWVPGSGVNIIIPNSNNILRQQISIFTEFGELSPTELLSVFREVINSPNYKTSPFLSMIESQLMKIETIETNLNDAVSSLEKNIVQDIEYNLTK